MAVPLHLLEAMRAAGCTLDQVLAVLRADLVERARRRELRMRLRSEAQQSGGSLQRLGQVGMNSPATLTGSGVVKLNDHDSDGILRPAGEAPQEVVYGTRKTVARQAILARLDLKPAARLVLAQLVDHHNLKTGRCDPSIARLARLAGVSARSASRALGELQGAGLVRVVVHGGWSHRNAYLVAWGALGFPAAGKLNDHDSAPTTTLVSADHDSGVVQTLSQNPDSESSLGKHRAQAAPGDRLQRELPLMRALPGGKTKADAAYGAAGTRLWGDLKRHGSEAERKPLFDLVIADPTLLEAATLAEVRAKGGGLSLLVETLAGGADGLRNGVPGAIGDARARGKEGTG